MSLVICSNRDDNYTFVDTEGNAKQERTGQANPASFANHFSNTFTIPKNAEVAVQSVKIERKNLLNLKETRYFNFWMGKELTQSTNYRHSTNLPILCSIRPGVYGVDKLTLELQKAMMTEGFNLHPDYYGNCDITPTFDSSQGGDGWEGWKYLFNTSGNQETLNNADTLLDWGDCGKDSTAGDYTITNASPGTGAKVLRTANTPDGELKYVIGKGNTSGQAMPISQVQGIYEFEPFGFSTQHYWETGLCRAVNKENLAPDWMTFDDALVESSTEESGFFDYKITWALRPDGKYGMFIEQAIVDEGTATKRDPALGENYGDYRMVEVGYFGVAGSSAWNVKLDEDNCQAGLNTTGASTKFNKFRFVVKGQDVHLQAFGSNKTIPAGQWYNIVKTSSSKVLTDPESGPATYSDGSDYKVPSSFKPVNMNQWNLYPKVGLTTQNAYIQITQYGGRANSGIFPTDDTPGTAFWARTWDPDTDNKFFGRLNDIRVSKGMDVGLMVNGIHDLPTYTPYELDTNNESPGHILAILPQSQSDTGYDEFDDYVYSSVKGNSSSILGFPLQTAVLNTKQGVSYRQNLSTTIPAPSAGWVVYSTLKPVFSSGTAFIRCPTLTHESLNMAKELPSKILYHIPRFSNSGREYGNLFFEPAEKTYMSLKNTEEIKLNELKLDIVNTSEKIIEDLTGTTTICLHFRKARY